MPAKMMIEMPLPSPRSVICSPSHIRNIVPVTSVTTVVMRNTEARDRSPGPAELSSATAMPSAWNSASPSVP